MEHREEKNELRKILAKHGVQRVKVASGDTFTRKKKNDRFQCPVNWTEKENSGDFDYVVKYFHTHKICIMWPIEGKREGGSPVRRSVYSVDVNDVLSEDREIFVVEKNVEHKGHEKELVYIAVYDKFEEFIKEMKWGKEV